MRVVRSLLGLALAGAVVVVLVLLLSGGSTNGYQVKLDVVDADGLLKGSRVEIGGVGVGSVKSLAIAPDDHALVTIAIDKADAPIGRNASAVVRPADLLGEKYVDLSVGNRADPAGSGFLIGAQHTRTATDFDQIVDTLGPKEQDRLAILIHETAVALYGRGTDVSKLLGALPPSLGDAQDLLSQLTASDDQLKALITHAGGVMASLGTNQNTLSQFVATAANALSASARHSSGLQQSVAEAPGLLTRLDTTLRQLDRAGADLRPAARGLGRTAPALTETLRELPGFTRAALPALTEVRSISPQLVTLGKRSSPVIAQLKPTLQNLVTFARAAKPVTNTLNSGIDDTLGTLQGWARALQESDGLSHMFRVSAEASPNLLSQFASALQNTLTGGQGSTPAKKPTSARPDPVKQGASNLANTVSGTTKGLANTLSNTTKNLGNTVSGTVNKVLGGVGKTLGGVGKTLGGVGSTLGAAGSKLGLTHTTTSSASPSTTTTGGLSSLLGYLLGGGK